VESKQVHFKHFRSSVGQALIHRRSALVRRLIISNRFIFDGYRKSIVSN